MFGAEFPHAFPGTFYYCCALIIVPAKEVSDGTGTVVSGGNGAVREATELHF